MCQKGETLLGKEACEVLFELNMYLYQMIELIIPYIYIYVYIWRSVLKGNNIPPYHVLMDQIISLEVELKVYI